MRPLRIVLVLLEPPLPFGDAAARWYYVLLKGLAARGHRVTTLAACSKAHEMEQAQELFPSPEYDLRCHRFPDRRGWWGKVRTLVRPYSYMFSREFRSELGAVLARGFDMLHLEQLWSGWTALPWRDRALLNVHFLHEIDAEGNSPATGRAWWERRLMLSAEQRLLRAQDEF